MLIARNVFIMLTIYTFLYYPGAEKEKYIYENGTLVDIKIG